VNDAAHWIVFPNSPFTETLIPPTTSSLSKAITHGKEAVGNLLMFVMLVTELNLFTDMVVNSEYDSPVVEQNADILKVKVVTELLGQ
jgi:hypothetical protein